MFKKVNPKEPLPNVEQRILKYWEDNKIFEKSVDQRKKEKKYVFFDGPPFANGLPHYGHILANVLKDAVTRYWSMRGYYVPRRNGWDCHGLPVEYEIEKELKLSGRKDVVDYGVENFNNKCRESVFRYTKEWEQTLKRIGRWVDFGDSYATLENTYMESIWWVFKQIWDKKLVYSGFKAMQICPRCETPLSNFEVSQGYKDVSDLSVTVKFELVDEPGTYFLAWTTTPWSLFTTMGLAVGKNVDYVKIATDQGNFILAEKRLVPTFENTNIEYKIIDRFKGSEIEGKKYKHLFDFYNNHPDVKKSEKVFHTMYADYVSDEDGTGIVTINGAYGEVDMESAIKYKLPMILNVKMDGTFTEETEGFVGKSARGEDLNIALHLHEKGLLFKKQNFKHSYPHCWRCDTPLLNYATKSLFIKATEIKDKMLANNKKIHWQPEHIQEGRFGKWLEGARDWAISRNRFWGCAIPVWECECGNQECIGSVEELKKKSGGKVPMRGKEMDLHKPYIDGITFKCEKCGGEMKRISDVLDCWFESGAMPYAQLHYPFENKKEFEDNFPANFIAEGLDQTRGWFYTLHVLSTILFDKPAFNNVIVNGIILAADGEKLSKRKKNYPDPAKIFDTMGVDSMRFFLVSSPAALADDVRFSEDAVDEVVKKLTLTLWNTYSFFVTYANIDKFEPKKDYAKFNPKNKLDKWILSELNTLIKDVTEQMDDYNLPKAARPMLDFVENLSNWYVRRSRRRFWKSENDGDKNEAYQTLYIVLVEFAKVIAPFMPYLSDEIYQNLTSEKSIHLSDWPKLNKSMIDEKLNKEIHLVRMIVNMGHSVRSKAKIKVRQPLKSITIALPADVSQKLVESHKDVILEELNVKELNFVKEAFDIVERQVVPNSKLLGPKYGKDVQTIIQNIKAGKFEVLKDGKVKVLDFVLGKEEVSIGFKGKEGFDVESDEGIVVVVDTTITDELKKEGYAREVVRFIQEMRKEADYQVDDRIQVLVKADGKISEAVTEFSDYIKKETLANEIVESGDIEWDAEKDVEVEANKLKIAVRKV
ncbi:MAG: isoleucine--tRNA ligase [Candidatus Gracilibacteria bacterium]|jgi:isoleucyl-tRNA synthetase